MPRTVQLFVLLAVIFISCNTSEVKPIEYSWQKSDALPPCSVERFKYADGKSLFISGNVNGIKGIFRLDNGTWTKLVETQYYADDFSVFNGVLYYGNRSGLYKVVNSSSVKMVANEPMIFSMEVYNNKLLISGDSIPVGSKFYSIASYDGTLLTPVSQFVKGNSMIVANDMLFIASTPISQYDGQALNYIYNEGQSDFANLAKDDLENIFFSAMVKVDINNLEYTNICTYRNGKIVILGDTLRGLVHHIQLFNNTLVIAGSTGPISGVSFYYLNNKWKQVAIPQPKIGGANMFVDMVAFNGRLIASPGINEGYLFELKRIP